MDISQTTLCSEELESFQRVTSRFETDNKQRVTSASTTGNKQRVSLQRVTSNEWFATSNEQREKIYIFFYFCHSFLRSFRWFEIRSTATLLPRGRKTTVVNKTNSYSFCRIVPGKLCHHFNWYRLHKLCQY